MHYKSHKKVKSKGMKMIYKWHMLKRGVNRPNLMQRKYISSLKGKDTYI